jgi:hypothetical protein
MTSKFGPINIPSITLSEEELAEARANVEQGIFPEDWFLQYRESLAQAVYGADFQRDRNGNPIQQGIGAPLNQSANSIASYKKYCSHEPDFERHLARMEKELEETNKRKAAEAAKGKAKTGWLGRS